MEPIEIFTGPGCSHCAAAKTLLRERGLAFTERDISDAAVLEEFRERLPRVRSLPQLFADGSHIGGYEDLRLYLKKDR
jgi:glutaredoxin 3